MSEDLDALRRFVKGRESGDVWTGNYWHFHIVMDVLDALCRDALEKIAHKAMDADVWRDMDRRICGLEKDKQQRDTMEPFMFEGSTGSAGEWLDGSCKTVAFVNADGRWVKGEPKEQPQSLGNTEQLEQDKPQEDCNHEWPENTYGGVCLKCGKSPIQIQKESGIEQRMKQEDPFRRDCEGCGEDFDKPGSCEECEDESEQLRSDRADLARFRIPTPDGKLPGVDEKSIHSVDCLCETCMADRIERQDKQTADADGETVQRSAHEIVSAIKAALEDSSLGGCRILSKGNGCDCVLCLVDELAELATPQGGEG